MTQNTSSVESTLSTTTINCSAGQPECGPAILFVGKEAVCKTCLPLLTEEELKSAVPVGRMVELSKALGASVLIGWEKKLSRMIGEIVVGRVNDAVAAVKAAKEKEMADELARTEALKCECGGVKRGPKAKACPTCLDKARAAKAEVKAKAESDAKAAKIAAEEAARIRNKAAKEAQAAEAQAKAAKAAEAAATAAQARTEKANDVVVATVVAKEVKMSDSTVSVPKTENVVETKIETTPNPFEGMAMDAIMALATASLRETEVDVKFGEYWTAVQALQKGVPMDVDVSEVNTRISEIGTELAKTEKFVRKLSEIVDGFKALGAKEKAEEFGRAIPLHKVRIPELKKRLEEAQNERTKILKKVAEERNRWDRKRSDLCVRMFGPRVSIPREEFLKWGEKDLRELLSSPPKEVETPVETPPKQERKAPTPVVVNGKTRLEGKTEWEWNSKYTKEANEYLRDNFGFNVREFCRKSPAEAGAEMARGQQVLRAETHPGAIRVLEGIVGIYEAALAPRTQRPAPQTDTRTVVSVHSAPVSTPATPPAAAPAHVETVASLKAKERNALVAAAVKGDPIAKAALAAEVAKKAPKTETPVVESAPMADKPNTHKGKGKSPKGQKEEDEKGFEKARKPRK